jgi:hypothetical protein
MCKLNGKEEIFIELWWGKPLVEPSHGRPRKKSEQNGKLDVKEIDCEDIVMCRGCA